VSLGAFLDEVAGPTADAGRRHRRRVTGALAASLAEMVANLTLGKKKYAAVESGMRELRA
jgi:formiminotetrahydrofolate cyclodeaminase